MISQARRRSATLSSELRGFFVAEDANRLFELFHLERLFQNGDWSFGENPVEHGAVRITGNDNNGAVGLFFFNRVVNVVGRTIRQFQIEKYEIEFLFLERGERFLDRADNDATESDFAEEQFEKVLQTFVVIDDENGGLAGFVLLENILVEGGLFDPPAPADLDGGQLATLNEIINGR